MRAKRYDLVRTALRGMNPEGRVYAAEALLSLARAGGELTAGDQAAIAKVRALKIPIRVCEGCIVGAEPAAKLLPE